MLPRTFYQYKMLESVNRTRYDAATVMLSSYHYSEVKAQLVCRQPHGAMYHLQRPALQQKS